MPSTVSLRINPAVTLPLRWSLLLKNANLSELITCLFLIALKPNRPQSRILMNVKKIFHGFFLSAQFIFLLGLLVSSVHFYHQKSSLEVAKNENLFTSLVGNKLYK